MTVCYDEGGLFPFHSYQPNASLGCTIWYNPPLRFISWVYNLIIFVWYLHLQVPNMKYRGMCWASPQTWYNWVDRDNTRSTQTKGGYKYKYIMIYYYYYYYMYLNSFFKSLVPLLLFNISRLMIPFCSFISF